MRSDAPFRILGFLIGSALAAPAAAGVIPEPKRPVSVRLADRGALSLNLREGRTVPVEYRGDERLTRALAAGSAEPRALASADLDRDGTPDLVAGYAHEGRGIVTVQHGNPDAFAPKDDSVFQRMQNGFNPEPFLDETAVYAVPEPADFIALGDFDGDGLTDVLTAARGGGLYLLSGDRQAGFEEARRIDLPGPVTALAAGEFGAADGRVDVAVAVLGPDGPALLIFDGASGSFAATPDAFPLRAPASEVVFGGLDSDPFMDVAVAAGDEVEIVHGWGRRRPGEPMAHVEHVGLPFEARSLAVGFFLSDRKGEAQIAVRSMSGEIQILNRGELEARRFSEAEIADRARTARRIVRRDVDVESVASWPEHDASGFTAARSFHGSGAGDSMLVRAHLSSGETDDLLALHETERTIEIIGETRQDAQASLMAADTLDALAAPVAALALPRKLNGEGNLVLLLSNAAEPVRVPLVARTITVDRMDDPVAIPSTCANATPNDCSLRGAVAFANANTDGTITTIMLPAGTYTLSINGAGGCLFAGESNSVGDLEINQSTTVMGAGAASTTILQLGNGNGMYAGDRIMCLNTLFTLNLAYSFSGVTLAGGRDASTFGGGGVIGGEKGNSLTLTNVVVSNNQVSGGNIGGGGIQITGGDLTIINSTIGGPNLPGANRSDTSLANAESTSGGGLVFTPSAPMHTGSTGILTTSGTTFTHNTAASLCCGGAAADLVILSFGSPGGIGTGSASIGTTTFSSNQATGVASGGAINVESLPTTVATSSFMSNSAGNRGGAIYVGGASLLLDGTGAGVTMSGNTAPSGGSSVSTGSAVTVSGTNVTLGGDIEITTGGTWTNAVGSTLSPTNILIVGGSFICNSGTMNVAGDLTLDPGAIVGGTFNAGSGVVNIGGNLTSNSGGSMPATTFTSGTGTFNFSGSGAQSIGGTLSPTFNNLVVNKSGGSTLTLNVNSPVASNLTVTAGVLDLAAFTANRTGAGGALTVSNGATLKIGGANSIPTNYTMHAFGTTSTIEYEGASTQAVAPEAYGNLTSSGSGARTLASGGTIGIAGAFTPGANAYTITGSTIDFNGGVAQAIPAFSYNNLTSSGGGARTLPPAGTVRIAGAFTPGANAYTITGSTVEYNGAAPQTLPSGFTTYNNLVLNNLAGTTGFPVLTSQTLVDVKAGTFTTGGTFNDGLVETGTTLAAVSAGTLSVNGTLTLTGGNVSAIGTLNLAGGLASSAAALPSVISGAGLVSLPAGSHAVTVANGAAAVDLDVTASITGLGGLTKSGAGTLRLTAPNGYAGPTVVNGGTLLVNGAQSASPVTVAAGVLGGSGLTGPLTGSGGVVSPGQSPGILSCGTLGLTPASTLAIELNGVMVGTQYDQLSVTGTVALGSAALSPSVGFVPAGQTFTIVSNDGSDPVTGRFAGLPEAASFAVGTTAFQITYAGGSNSNDVVLTNIPCTAPSATTPGNQTVCPGSTAMLTTTASGVGPLTYQWRKTSVPLANGGNISGATSATLSISSAGAGDQGSYDCVVTGGCAPPFTTGAATLTVSDPTAPVVTPPPAATVTQTLCM